MEWVSVQKSEKNGVQREKSGVEKRRKWGLWREKWGGKARKVGSSIKETELRDAEAVEGCKIWLSACHKRYITRVFCQSRMTPAEKSEKNGVT